MGSSFDREVARLATQQHGVFARHQHEALGGTRSRERTRLGSGRWWSVHPAVFAIAGAALTWEGRVLAACLAAPGAVASHRSAARLWQLDGSFPQQPEISVPRGRRPRLAGVTVHETTDSALWEVQRRRSIPVTGLGRTVVDLGAVLRPARVGQTVDHVLRAGLLDLDALWSVYVRHRRRGRNGTGVLRGVLESVAAERGVHESFFERLVFELLVDAGLPRPVVQHEVRDGHGRFVARLDLAYPPQRIAIELLGKQYHLTDAAFERDPRRRNRLELLGWAVLEFTWRAYVDQPGRLCAAVAEAVRTRPTVGADETGEQGDRDRRAP